MPRRPARRRTAAVAPARRAAADSRSATGAAWRAAPRPHRPRHQVQPSRPFRPRPRAALPTAPSSPQDQAVAEAMGRLDHRRGPRRPAAAARLDREQRRGGPARPARPARRAASSSSRTRRPGRGPAINQRLKQIARDANLLEPLIAIDHEGGIVQRIKDVPNLGYNWDFGLRNPTEPQACQRGRNHAQALSGARLHDEPGAGPRRQQQPGQPGHRRALVLGRPAARRAARRAPTSGGSRAAAWRRSASTSPATATPASTRTVGLPIPPADGRAAGADRAGAVPARPSTPALAGIMSAHIVFPAVDPSGDPATLSRPS